MSQTNIARFPVIPQMDPITVRPKLLDVSTRVEIVSNVIAGVLHNAFCTQNGLPGTPLAHSQPAVQRVYEGMARLAVLPLLDPEAVQQAEAAAIGQGLTILGDYMDEDDDDGIPADIWEHRITTAVRAAIATYTAQLMAVPR